VANEEGGLAVAVPTADRQGFVDHATRGDCVFIDLGATLVIGSGGNRGERRGRRKVAGFRKAVQAEVDVRLLLDCLLSMSSPISDAFGPDDCNERETPPRSARS
jgi:uncharacterized protein YbaA (DUF1428 family)